MKISASDIELFAKYDGDLDSLSRSGLSGKINYNTWQLIDRLVTALRISYSVPTSDAFSEQLEKDLASSMADSAAEDSLNKYAAGR